MEKTVEAFATELLTERGHSQTLPKTESKLEVEYISVRAVEVLMMLWTEYAEEERYLDWTFDFESNPVRSSFTPNMKKEYLSDRKAYERETDDKKKLKLLAHLIVRYVPPKLRRQIAKSVTNQNTVKTENAEQIAKSIQEVLERKGGSLQDFFKIVEVLSNLSRQKFVVAEVEKIVSKLGIVYPDSLEGFTELYREKHPDTRKSKNKRAMQFGKALNARPYEFDQLEPKTINDTIQNLQCILESLSITPKIAILNTPHANTVVSEHDFLEKKLKTTKISFDLNTALRLSFEKANSVRFFEMYISKRDAIRCLFLSSRLACSRDIDCPTSVSNLKALIEVTDGLFDDVQLAIDGVCGGRSCTLLYETFVTHGSMELPDWFLPMRSKIHPLERLPIIDQRNKNKISKEIWKSLEIIGLENLVFALLQREQTQALNMQFTMHDRKIESLKGGENIMSGDEFMKQLKAWGLIL